MDLSEERLQQLALNKLRSLPAQVYLANGVILGRLEIDPDRFRLLEGLDLERHQPFVVQSHERIQFVPPSPLTHLGEIRYFELADAAALCAAVENRWRIAIERARRSLLSLRRLDPQVRLHAGSWTIEADIDDRGTPVHLSFHADGGYFRVVTIGSEIVEDAQDWSRGIIRVDLKQGLPKLMSVVRTAVDAATRRSGARQVDASEKHFVPVDDYANVADIAEEVVEVEPPRESIRVWYDSTPIPDPSSAGPVDDDPFRDPHDQIVPPKYVSEFGDLVLVGSESDTLDEGIIVVDTDDDEESVPITFSSSVSEVSDVDIMFEDAVELDFTVAQRHAIRRRPRRLMIDVRARLESARGPSTVRIMQVNAGGVFAAIPFAAAPIETEEVLLRGFGPRAVRARVVHRRPLEEARLVGTPEGVGLAFCSEVAGASAYQEAPHALVVMRDGPARDRAVAALVRDGYQIIVAENLVAASAAFYQQAVGVVLMDESVHGGMWTEIGEALAFDQHRVPVVLIASRIPRIDPRVTWGRIIELGELDGRLISEVVETFRARGLATG